LILDSCSFVTRVRVLASKAPESSFNDWTCNKVEKKNYARFTF
jgi:hypothetical protein